ncbi:hypothetical protein F157LOC_01029 [Pectobacterium brasiliense]|uniref:hypothetical protein n=1 Tax=Pectobacterium brasiliense TaxID=180957 RepID=UPI000CE6959D|nr:hypothetical protein [Pectobacterium brasiliense]PPE62189.1 hypothetical protein F157LOC_01029 [Pectobacterium brasiliense]
MMLESAEHFFRACEIFVSGSFVEIREDEIYPGVGVMNFLVIDHDHYGPQEIFVTLDELPFLAELGLLPRMPLVVPVEVWQGAGASMPYLTLSGRRDIVKK